MTPTCCNCLYFRSKDSQCHNPDSMYYLDEMRFVDKCRRWEHFREFEHEERRRWKHGTKR